MTTGKSQPVQTLRLLNPHEPGSPAALLCVQDARDTKRPHVFFFVGFGEQRDSALRAALKPFVEAGFSATAIAILFDKQTIATTEWLLDEGMGAVLQQLRPRNRKYILAGISRGAAVAAHAASQPTDGYEGLVMVSPLGLSKIPGGVYIRNTLRDQAKNKNFLDKEARKNAVAVAKEMYNHARSSDGLPAALDFAMNQQERTQRGIRHAVKSGKLLGVFVGENDLVFPAEDCRHTLETIVGEAAARDIFHTMPGGHAATASATGQQQLRTVAKWLVGNAH